MGASYAEHFETRGTGQQEAGDVAAALPANKAKLVNVRAAGTNTNSVFVGLAGVAIATGFELTPGDATGWLPVADTSDLFVIVAAGTEDVSFIFLT